MSQFLLRSRRSALITFAFLLFALPSTAATIVVTSLDDNVTTNGEVTLREAFIAATNDVSSDGSVAGNGADTIVFHPALNGGVIVINSEFFDINGTEITFDASGLPAGITIDGQDFTRLMFFQGGATIGIVNITLTKGSAPNSGGAIYMHGGSLSLTDVVVSGNTAADMGGGIFISSATDLTIIDSTIRNNTADESGGGVSFSGPVSSSFTMTNSRVVANRSGNKGGGVMVFDGVGNFTDAAIDSNIAESTSTLSSLGGGLYSEGDLTLLRTTINDNQSLPGTSNSQAGHAGGIYNLTGTLSLTDCEISRNIASSNTAGCGLNNAYSVSGSGVVDIVSTTISDNTAASGVGVYNSGTMTITDSWILNNIGTLGLGGSGGGISNSFTGANLTLTNTVIDGNSAERGGGLNVGTGTICTINGGAVSNNTADNDGGGIVVLGSLTIADVVVRDNQADIGGGIERNSLATLLFLERCTVSGNVAYIEGGGMHLDGSADFEQVTVSGNSATENGGGLYIEAGSSLSFRQSTISANSANIDGGGVLNRGQVSLGGTIVSANTAWGAGSADVENDAGGTTSSVGFNLIGDTNDPSWLGTDMIGVLDPGLSALADNGGPTETMAVLPGSPALDASSVTISGPFGTDQRGTGFPRLLDGDNNSTATADIGAYEFEFICDPIVTTVVDGDTGSLRDILSCVEDNSTITFDPSLTGQTLPTNSALLLNRAVTIDATGMNITIDVQGLSRVMSITTGTVVELIELTITGGQSTRGGGISNDGDLTLTRCRIVGNSTTGDGGGIANNNTGTLSVFQSEVADNQAGIDGGAIENDGDLSLVLSTVTGNTANDHGGGLHSGGTDVAISSSTIAGNGGGNGGGVFHTAGSMLISSTILNDNTATANDDFGRSGAGGFSSGGYNLVGDGGTAADFGQPTDFYGVEDPRLGLLVDNGGPTRTFSLLFGSDAIDAGKPSHCALTIEDQRGAGYPRDLDGDGDGTAACDIGAFESELLTFGIPLVVDDVPAVLFFNSYLGAGFAPSPTADQLDSDGIVVAGVSDESTPMHFGHTADTGDYARGPVVGGTTVGGIYAFDVGGGNPALGFQPSVGDMTPGQIYFAYRNQTGGQVTSIRLEHLVYVYNGGDRVTGLRVRYAQEMTPVTNPSALAFLDVAGSDIVSPGAADPAPTWAPTAFDLTINDLTIPDGGCFYLSFSTVSPVGSGDWDGFALDNIKVRANPATSTGVDDTPMFASGQSHLMSSVYPNPFNPRASFSLAVRDEQQVRIDMYDTAGRRVRVLFEGVMPAQQEFVFDLDGRKLASSVYFVRVTGESFTETTRAVLIK